MTPTRPAGLPSPLPQHLTPNGPSDSRSSSELPKDPPASKTIAGNIGDFHQDNRVTYQTIYQARDSQTGEGVDRWFEIFRYSNNKLSRLTSLFDDLATHHDHLMRDGVLMVSSRLKSVAGAGADRICELLQLRFPHIVPWHMHFTGFEGKFSRLITERERIGETSKHAMNGGSNILLLVEADGQAAIDAIKDGIPAFLHTDELTRHQVYVLIIAGGEAAARASWPERLANWQVPPLPALLAHYQMPDLEERIRRISESNTRGGTETKDRLVDTVHDILLSHPGDLPKLVDEWERGGFASWLRKTARPDLPESSAERSALLLGTFFPSIPFVQFDRLMEILLEGESEPTPPPSGDPPRPVVAEKSRDRWQRNSRQVLRNMELEPFEDESGQRIVAFCDPGMAVAMAANFPDDRFLLDQIKRLHSWGIMLAARTPDATADKLARTTSNMAKWYPDHFNEDWVLDVFENAILRIWDGILKGGASRNEGWWNRPPKSGADKKLISPEELEKILLVLECDIDESGRVSSDVTFERLKQLCLAQGDNKLVERFLEKMIARYRETPAIPLNLIRRLRKNDRFDPLDWLRRLLAINDAHHTAVMGVWRALLDESDLSLSREFDVLSQVFGWMQTPPARDAELDQTANGTPSESPPLAAGAESTGSPVTAPADAPQDVAEKLRDRAAVFLYAWCQHAKKQKRFLCDQGWEERVELLANWMTHSRFSAALERVTRQLDFEHPLWAALRGGLSVSASDLVFAEMLETLNCQECHARAIEMLARSLKEDWAQTAPSRRTNIRRLLENRINSLNEQIGRNSGEAATPIRAKLYHRAARATELIGLL